EGAAKVMAKTLSDLIAKEPPSLKWSPVYTELLRTAGPAGLSDNEVRGYLDKWLAAAAPYGARLVNNVRTDALKALRGPKPYAGLSLALADEAEKQAGADAPTELKAEIARGMADAASLLGKTDVAQAAEAKYRTFDAALDAEYKKNVPPFKPAPAAGRKGKG